MLDRKYKKTPPVTPAPEPGSMPPSYGFGPMKFEWAIFLSL